MECLHAPWRIHYILSPKPAPSEVSLFSRIAQSSDDAGHHVIARDRTCYALLNNDLVLLDSAFAQKFRHAHASDRKINKVKLNDGLICVAGEDQKVTFYDPLVPQPVKAIAST